MNFADRLAESSRAADPAQAINDVAARIQAVQANRDQRREDAATEGEDNDPNL